MGKQKNFKQEKKVNFTQVCNFWRALGKISVFLSFCVFSVFLTFSFFFFFFFCWGSFSYKDFSYKKTCISFCLPVIITKVFSRLFYYSDVIYLFKVNNNRNTRIMCGICSRLTIRTNEINDDVLLSLYYNFERISRIVLGFLLLTCNK